MKIKLGRRARGFALVVTLSLMILLTVVAIGLLSLSSISLRSSSAEAAQQTARQNARLGLMLALGELQVHLGPDTRTTARAETLAMDDRVAATVAPNSPQAWWVGVSDSDRSKTLGTSDPRSVIWLLSGLSGNTPGAQLSGNLNEPVDMIGSGSLDLALSGGKPIQAGRVTINQGGQATGAYAYFIDDNGMKAQLASSRPQVRNDLTAGPGGRPLGGGVLPGTYPLNILDQMGGLAGVDLATYQKLVSSSTLPLIGLSKPIAKSKFFSYTTTSQGVLSDVKKGGLKKDLTVAFENPSVFNLVFPVNQPDKYILVDPAKRPRELTQHGYIHWGIFRDYYNLKKSINVVNRIPTLAPHLFEKAGLLENSSTAFHRGQLGPHSTGGSLTPSPHQNHPYGTFSVSPTKSGDPAAYQHNPITPVLAMLQQNAWVSRPTASTIRTHVQMFTSHYNPYNVGINLDANNASNVGPRIIKYPQVLFTVGGLNRQPGLDGKLQAHTSTPVLLEPGRSHIMGFRLDGNVGKEIDGQLYSQEVAQIVTQSVTRDHSSAGLNLTGQNSVTYEFAFREPSMSQGMDEHPGDREVSQVFFSPFSWDSIPAFSNSDGPRPGKRMVKNLTATQLNENSAVSLGFFLRTTREKTSPIRPLVDANIRAIWNNPKWDSPLNLPLLASFSADLNGGAPQRMPQMKPEPPRGFSYWGNDRAPSGANDRVVLFDVPRRDLLSLGQLQHANAGRFSYEPTYIVGNSYANLRIPLADWRASITDTFSAARKVPWPISGSFNLYDASYLVNEVLFDSYTFTTIPQTNDNYGGGDVPVSDYPRLLAGTVHLPNPRYLPYRPAGSGFTSTQLRAVGTATTGSFFHNAGHVVVDGVFNVNSTSVDAWEAFLSGTHKLPVQKLSANGVIGAFAATDGVRFPRASSHLGEGMKTSSINENYWTGFRELEQKEVREIATELVAQIKLRGPFLSLGEFVNRKLVSGDLGKSGALQAALDATVNQKLDTEYEAAADTSSYQNLPAGSTQGAGFPGQILQGDVLQALAPYMSVRSDTFTIRSYGEARGPGNRVTARAYCEAVVQRFPDPSPASSNSQNVLGELAMPSSRFGRQFKILSFRWLAPAEV
jgi:hypothetical protein